MRQETITGQFASLRGGFLVTACGTMFGAICGAFMALFFAMVLVMAPMSQAAAQIAPDVKEYRIDPDHTRILFFVDHLGLSKFPGQFYGVGGSILFNFKTQEASKADITIDVRKLSMGIPALDRELQSKELFNAAKYPHITFKSTKITKKSVSHGTMTGDLTLLGVTRPVTLDVVYNGRKWNHYRKAEFAGFSAKAKIRRSDFGMKAHLPDIGDEVTLMIEVEAREVRPALFAQ